MDICMALNLGYFGCHNFYQENVENNRKDWKTKTKTVMRMCTKWVTTYASPQFSSLAVGFFFLVSHAFLYDVSLIGNAPLLLRYGYYLL